jgi:hypothetical protein
MRNANEAIAGGAVAAETFIRRRLCEGSWLLLATSGGNCLEVEMEVRVNFSKGLKYSRSITVFAVVVGQPPESPLSTRDMKVVRSIGVPATRLVFGNATWEAVINGLQKHRLPGWPI